MNENMNPCTTTIDENGHPYSNRLRQLRIKSGKSEEEICNLLSMAFIDYDELENHSGELTRVISLDEISKLARALGVPSRKIFSDSIETEKLVSLNQLS